MTKKTVLQEILAERMRQDELKASGQFPFICADLDLLECERLAILGEEFGEVCHEVNEGIGQNFSILRMENLRKELIQVAAVSLAWIQSLDKRITNAK